MVLRRSIETPLTRSERRRKHELWDAAQAALIDEIVGAAARITRAKGPDGDPVLRTDPSSELLSTLARVPYRCSLSDVGRLMRVSRQHAHRLAARAERAGHVELALHPEDRRIVQVVLTSAGVAKVADMRRRRGTWASRLLLGLDARRLDIATRVVRGIRERLARAEEEERRRR